MDLDGGRGPLNAALNTAWNRLGGRSKVALTAFVVASFLTLLTTLSPPFAEIERSIYDTRLRLWQDALENKPLDNRLRLIGLEDSSRAAGWTDQHTLQLLRSLHEAGVARVEVFGGEVFQSPGALPSQLPSTTHVLARDEGNVLFSSLPPGLADPDGVVRSLPVGGPQFALVQELAGLAGGTAWLPFGDRFFIAFEPTRDSSGVEDDYLAPLPIQSLAASLRDAEIRKLYRGAVVLIARTTLDGQTRTVSTPVGSEHPALLYASAANTMLGGWNPYTPSALASTLLTLVVIGLFTRLLSGRRPLVIFSSALAGLVGTAMLSLQLFAWGVNLRVGQLMVGIFLGLLTLVVLEFSRAKRALSSLGGAEDADLSGQETQATIVFTELPGYLMELEHRQDKDLLSRRRDYNRLVEQVARKYHGQVLDYQGDAQMVGFGLRHAEDSDHPLEATAAAMEMVELIPSLAETWGISSRELRVHAGVCTGVVALGHVGALQKQDVAAIGDTTNTAARLMGAAMKLDLPVVVAETTFDAAGGKLSGRSLPPVELKGKSAPVAIYAVDGVDEEWRRANARQRKERIPSGGTIVYRRQSRADLVATLVLSAVAFAFLQLMGSAGIAFPIEGTIYDGLMRTTGLAPSDPRIVLVGIDGESCAPEHLGAFPWSRGVYALALRNLQRSGYAGIFFDIAFKQPREGDAEGDRAFAEVLFQEPRAKVGGALYEESGRLRDPLFFLDPGKREQLRQRNQIGLIHRREDVDGILRWAVLAARETESSSREGRLYPTGAVSLLLGPEDTLRSTPEGLRVGARALPSTEGDFPNELLIRFGPAATQAGSPPLPGSYRYISFWRLLEPPETLPDLKGAYLLVGDTFQGGERDESDRVMTPVGSLKGVEGHARTLDTILSQDYIHRIPRWALIWWEAVLAVLTTYVLARYRTPRDYIPRLLGVVVLQVAVYAVSLIIFSVWLELIHPLSTVLGICAAVLLGRYVLTLRALSRFVPAEVAEEILFHHGARDRRLVATVLLTDIRGYTTLSEGRSAVAMLDILNEYHRRTVGCYERHGGQALTYQGDAQIVVFGVFGRRRNPAKDAVAAALELQAICAELRREWGIERQDDFDVGAGLCTGEVEVGFLGGRDNLQYSVVGETVRKSHKVQSMSTELEAPVILDEETFYAGFGHIVCDDLGLVQLKGIEGESRLYRARGVSDKAQPV